MNKNQTQDHGIKARRSLGFLRDTRGNATMEFLVIFPFLSLILFIIGEVGALMVRNVQLERAVDLAVRDVRLGDTSVASHDGLKTRICEHTFLLGSCDTDLLLELTSLGNALGANTTVPAGYYNCRNREEDISPVVNFDASGPGEIVVVRACLVVDPIFPGAGTLAMLPHNVGGGYAILTQSAFINEPG